MITYDRLFIGGAWVEPGSPELLAISSPHDRSLIGRAAQAQPSDVDRAVAAARISFDAGVWRTAPPRERISSWEASPRPSSCRTPTSRRRSRA
ncbi:aldehyde dehydrogenase family protein [Streptomyces tibetensis]